MKSQNNISRRQFLGSLGGPAQVDPVAIIEIAIERTMAGGKWVSER